LRIEADDAVGSSLTSLIGGTSSPV
jgi:hypothetical protein